MRLCVLFSLATVLAAQDQKAFRLQVPRMWNDVAMADLELPWPSAEHSLRMVSSEYYYRIPVRPVYKTYPVYARDREPSGYLEWLRQKESAYVFDAAKLKTEQDWIRAGELVFDAPIVLESPGAVFESGGPPSQGSPGYYARACTTLLKSAPRGKHSENSWASHMSG